MYSTAYLPVIICIPLTAIHQSSPGGRWNVTFPTRAPEAMLAAPHRGGHPSVSPRSAPLEPRRCSSPVPRPCACQVEAAFQPARTPGQDRQLEAEGDGPQHGAMVASARRAGLRDQLGGWVKSHPPVRPNTSEGAIPNGPRTSKGKSPKKTLGARPPMTSSLGIGIAAGVSPLPHKAETLDGGPPLAGGSAAMVTAGSAAMRPTAISPATSPLRICPPPVVAVRAQISDLPRSYLWPVLSASELPSNRPLCSRVTTASVYRRQSSLTPKNAANRR